MVRSARSWGRSASSASCSAYLADLARQGKIGLAGRFEDDSGSVFLYGAQTREELAELMDNDPYMREGVIAERTVGAFVPGVTYGLPPEDHYD